MTFKATDINYLTVSVVRIWVGLHQVLWLSHKAAVKVSARAVGSWQSSARGGAASALPPVVVGKLRPSQAVGLRASAPPWSSPEAAPWISL